MSRLTLNSKLDNLCSLPAETEWVEFKHNNADPNMIGEYLSALSNSAVLHDQPRAWLVWGIEDGTHAKVGTNFKPRTAKVGNQDLEGWLTTKSYPRVEFLIHEFEYAKGIPIVIFEILPCWHTPVRFEEFEYIRVGSTKRRLRDYPEKERQLWERFRRTPFEKAICKEKVTGSDVLKLIDYPELFKLLALPLPEGKSGILERLVSERFINETEELDCFDITNLGAILFANQLSEFETLSRKSVRVIVYKGVNRIDTMREQQGSKGYACGFEGLIDYINNQLPANEILGKAFQKDFQMYPEVAIRELVANALIHQDFSKTGDGPKVEIFSDRVEITNPGRPLIDTLRFVDEPPQSRNENLAAIMRRMKICEERGSGIDKTLAAIELFQLPAPDFRTTDQHTIALLFADVPFSKMEKGDKIRACYLHACLKRVSNDSLTNESLRTRLNVEDKDYPKVSRIIRDTVEAELIKPADPTSKSRKHAKYLPFWA